MIRTGSMALFWTIPLKTVLNVVKRSKSLTIWKKKEISSLKQTWKTTFSQETEASSNNTNPSSRWDTMDQSTKFPNSPQFSTDNTAAKSPIHGFTTWPFQPANTSAPSTFTQPLITPSSHSSTDHFTLVPRRPLESRWSRISWLLLMSMIILGDCKEKAESSSMPWITIRMNLKCLMRFKSLRLMTLSMQLTGQEDQFTLAMLKSSLLTILRFTDWPSLNWERVCSSWTSSGHEEENQLKSQRLNSSIWTSWW